MQGASTKEAGASSTLAPGQEVTARKARRRIVAPNGLPDRPKRLTDAQAQLVADHWPAALKVAEIQAERFPGLPIDWESSAALSLCDVVTRFDPDRGLQFWTLAYERIRFGFVDAMRANRLMSYGRNRHYSGAPKVESLSQVLAPDENGSAFVLSDTIPNEDEPIGWAEESIDSIVGLTRGLTRTARQVVLLYHLHGLTIKKIARRLGISESRVSQIRSAALDQLREAITNRSRSHAHH